MRLSIWRYRELSNLQYLCFLSTEIPLNFGKLLSSNAGQWPAKFQSHIIEYCYIPPWFIVRHHIRYCHVPSDSLSAYWAQSPGHCNTMASASSKISPSVSMPPRTRHSSRVLYSVMSSWWSSAAASSGTAATSSQRGKSTAATKAQKLLYTTDYTLNWYPSCKWNFQLNQNVCFYFLCLQGSFCVCVQPMRDGVTV